MTPNNFVKFIQSSYITKMATTVLKSTSSTFLKTEPIASVKLDDHSKKGVRKDTVITVNDIEVLSCGHYKVTIDGNGEGIDFKTFHVYAPHWGIVETDDPAFTDGKPKVDCPAVQRQYDRISKYFKSGKDISLDIKTSYYSQRDNYTMSHRTCNSSSNAMYLDWLLRVTGVNPKGLGGDDGYLKKVLDIGDTIYHHVQTQAIQQYGFSTKWMTDGDYSFVEDLICEGFPVVANILHRGSTCAPRGGHIILLIGQKSGNFIAHDPYGTLSSNYGKHDGRFSKINEEEFKIRWQGGYRILA